MRLVLLALSRPVAIIVALIALAIAATFAVQRMRVDIFPTVGDPAIYVSQPYAGMDPRQMEGFITYYYEYHFLYIPRIKYIQSKHIQGSALMKLVFEPGTDMNEATSLVVMHVNRSRGLMPPTVVPPFVFRFDAGSIPVGTLVMSSPTRSVGEMQDYALNYVRPLFVSLPGVAAPPPWGGNQRSVIIRLDPERLRAYRLSAEDAIKAVSRATQIVPSGNVRIGDINRIVNANSVLGANILKELPNAPVRTESGPTVYIRDIGVVEDGIDIITDYAHVNGKRTIILPVIKRPDASTLSVIKSIREQGIPAMSAAVPEDVKISLEFDQSVYVANAIRNLVHEGILGAVLAGLMVLLFLRDWRSMVIVVLNIPAALMAALIAMWMADQTVNLMTLGGLALAVSMLVDEATVVIENIHAQLASGRSRAMAVVEAGRATGVPRLAAMLCVLAVFVPSIFMSGVAKQLFVPLSLAVAFSMIASYILSSTLLPVLSTWLVREAHGEKRGGLLARLKEAYQVYLEKVLDRRVFVAAIYGIGAIVILGLLFPRIGTEIFPQSDGTQFELLIRAPTGTRVERTEEVALQALHVIEQTVGKENVEVSTGFIGVHPPNYPVNHIFLWTTGPHEAVLQVALKGDTTPLKGEALREQLRANLHKAIPGVSFSFQAGDIVSRVMSFGAATPIEVAVQGKNLDQIREHAEKIRTQLEQIHDLRDIQFGQPLDYPTVDVNIDRDRAGQFGLSMLDVSRSAMMATLSSRWLEPNFWQDPKTGQNYQIQVEVPQHLMTSAEDVESLGIGRNGESRPLLGDVADVHFGNMPAEIERINSRRVISITANIENRSLGAVLNDLHEAVARAGDPPRGVVVSMRGQVPSLEETIGGLQQGLLLAVGAIFLLLTAYFQSFRLALAIIGTAPAVLVGVVISLTLTQTTLNVQSFVGTIMAIGIAMANSILLVSFAEKARTEGASIQEAVITGALGRLRPILMTALAMVAGMIPMALGLGEGGAQAAPLGRAVIGGVLFATAATLTALPILYALLLARASTTSPSLNPLDPRSRFYEAA